MDMVWALGNLLAFLYIMTSAFTWPEKFPGRTLIAGANGLTDEVNFHNPCFYTYVVPFCTQKVLHT
jgi:hypothetical protein